MSKKIYKSYDETAEEINKQRKAQEFLDSVVEDLFNYPPKITESRKERIDLLDNYFNEYLAHGMSWDYYPEDYSQLLFLWESIHYDTCIDLSEDKKEK